MNPAPVDILCAVSRHTGVHPSILCNPRYREHWKPRAVYAYLLRTLLGYSYPEIADEVGYASHTPVMNIFKSCSHALSIATDSELSVLYTSVMSDLDMDGKPMKPGSAKLMSKGRVVAEMSSRLDGSVLVTFPGYPNERLVVADWMKAGEMAKAWLAERGQEKEAA